jgi:hypothetical protein
VTSRLLRLCALPLACNKGKRERRFASHHAVTPSLA